MKIKAVAKITYDGSGVAKDMLSSAVARGLWRIGAEAEAYAKVLCPVDTGRLRSSITHTNDGKAAYIGTNVEYGKYVELGTKHHKAQPFLRPAAQNHTDVYTAIMEQELKQAR